MKNRTFKKHCHALSLGMVFALLFTVAAYAAEEEKVITGVHFLPAEPVVSVNAQGNILDYLAQCKKRRTLPPTNNQSPVADGDLQIDRNNGGYHRQIYLGTRNNE